MPASGGDQFSSNRCPPPGYRKHSSIDNCAAMPETESHNRLRRLPPAIAVSAIVLVAVCCAAFALGQRAIENVNKLFGGSDGLQVVLRPEKVEAFRVAPLHKTLKGGTPETIGGAGMLSGPVT